MQLINLRSTALRNLAMTLALVLATEGHATLSKASDWVGRSVVTQDGQPLGRIEDFAIDIEQKSVAFLVVSVGSFLIDDALIAVDPDALGPSADGEHLVLNSDDLKQARRFNPDNWPAAADVLPTLAEGPAPRVPAGVEPRAEPSAAGRAVISDGRRQVTLADGEERMEPMGGGKPAAADSKNAAKAVNAANALPGGEIDAGVMPLPAFTTLDRNSDERLDRSEFGAYLGLKEQYQDIDLDDDGQLDKFEFDLLRQTRSR